MMDSNGQISDDSDIQRFMSEFDLDDLHSETPAPSTYIGSTKRSIDHMMGCSTVKQSMTSSGSLSYIEGPQSDHRGLFVDLNPLKIFRAKIAPLAMVAHNARLLKSGNPESVTMYQESMQKYYSDHNMADRLEEIYEKRHTLSATKLRSLLEKWDADQGKAMQHAEKQLSRPKKPFQWSPALRNAGIIHRYWRLRLQEATTGTLDYSETFQRMQQQITAHEPTFRIPFLGDHVSTENIKINLNKSERHMKQCQKDSHGLRYRCYQDLLATYESDNNPETHKESKRKSNIVKNTIKSEQCKAMHSNIRNTVKPTPYGGINRILVPRHKDMQQYPTNFQEFLATTEEHDIQWDTILDKTSIDLNLLRFNRNHFRAASASPCGKGTIHEKLTFTSLSRPAQELLKGHIPKEWNGNDELL